MEEKTQDKYKESIEGEPEALKEVPPVEPAPKKPLALEEKGIEAGKEKAIEKRSEVEPEKEKKIEEVLEEESGQTQKPLSDKVKDKVKEIQVLDKENQVKALVVLAIQKDPDFAIEVAKGLNNPYVLDKFHEKLTEDEEYKILIEKQKLKKL